MKLSEKVLKWVEREYGVMTADNVAKDIIEKTIEEIRKRVKELLKEIEKKQEETLFIHKYGEGFYDALKFCKDLIKKAFEGVI